MTEIKRDVNRVEGNDMANDVGCVAGSTMDEFIDCLKEALSRICGQEAGDWIYTAKQIYFGPTKKQLRCSDTRMYSNGNQLQVDLTIAHVCSEKFCLVYTVHHTSVFKPSRRNE